MLTFARLNDAGEVLETRDFEPGFEPGSKANPVLDLPAKACRWRPIVEDGKPDFDAAVEILEDKLIVEGPRVRRTWSVSARALEPIKQRQAEIIRGRYRAALVDALPDLAAVTQLAGRRDAEIAAIERANSAVELSAAIKAAHAAWSKT
jgi:hypothetical protein